MPRRLAAGLLLLCAACTDDAPETTTALRAEELTRGEAIDPATPPETTRAMANDLERQAKAAYRTPLGPTPVKIDWAEASAYPRLDPRGLPDAQLPTLDEITLPALLPADPALLATAKLIRGELWYAASMRGEDGLTLHLHGTRGAFEVPGATYPTAARKIADDYTLTRTHGIVSLRFNAFGAAYSVDVECAAPATDPRCAEDDFALTLAESLQVANPAAGATR